MPDPVPDPAPPPPAQPFYTSKSFWTLALGAIFAFLSYFHVIPVTTDASQVIDGILLLLGLVFRWGANQPLTTKSIGQLHDGQVVQKIS